MKIYKATKEYEDQKGKWKSIQNIQNGPIGVTTETYFDTEIEAEAHRASYDSTNERENEKEIIQDEIEKARVAKEDLKLDPDRFKI